MIKHIIAAAALATLAASASAAAPGTTYAGMDIGATKADDVATSTSYGAFAGYNFNQNFAVEAGYRRLWWDSQDWTEQDITQLSASVIGSIPVHNAFSVYGRLGYNRLDAKASMGRDSSIKAHTNKVLVGVGVKYDFDGNISGRVEVQRPANNDTINLSAGIVYAF